jgi:hypothetical protein
MLVDFPKIGKKITFYFYFSPPPKVRYMWALILNDNDVNSSGVAFYHGLAPFVLLVALHKLPCGCGTIKLTNIQMTISK